MEVAPLVSAEQRATFERAGYLVVSDFLDGVEALRLAEWTDELASYPEVPGRHMVYYEDSSRVDGERLLSRIENFCPHHEGFRGLLTTGRVVEIVSELLGEPAVLFKDKINFKMPGGSGFKAHQDVQAGWDRYAALHLTVLISIDEATVDNGCLELVAGAHRGGLLGDMWKPLDDGQLEYVPRPTRPGDALLFDSFVPHRSEANHTDHPRRVLYVTYNRASEGDHRGRYYADKRASFPPDCERDPGKRYVYRV